MAPIRQDHRRSAGGYAAKAISVALCIAIGLVSVATLLAPSSAQQAAPAPPAGPTAGQESLEKCPSTASLEGRLVMEQWAETGNCERPVRTRMTDRFLGFSCLEATPESTTCRAFVPPPTSRAFDTSRVFRCVDLALTPTEQGTVLTRMREWVAHVKGQCDWSQSRDLLTMEVDFATGDVCAGNLCMSAAKLSTVGKLRLRHLIEKALRELDLVSWTASLHSPVAARTR